jgi:hypothetical protein
MPTPPEALRVKGELGSFVYRTWEGKSRRFRGLSY